MHHEHRVRLTRPFIQVVYTEAAALVIRDLHIIRDKWIPGKVLKSFLRCSHYLHMSLPI
jgi:hypothetical protein